MLKRLFAKVTGADTVPHKLSYEEARSALESHAHKARHFLAGQPEVEPEILYYLATDQSVEVRRCVAANPSTPQKANHILVRDGDDEVRCELAKKIGRLVPGLGPNEAHRVRELAIEVMERLANDALPRVRAILAEEIKSARNIPAHIVRRLALDMELIVSAPVLEYSPLLSDDDLIEIIAGARVEGKLAAIARRAAVGASVSDAIVATLDVSAVAALLANPNAQIREDTLDRVIESAAEIEAWHLPVVLRADLSVRAVRRIAGFVASSLIGQLQQRSGLDEETATLLGKRVRERIDVESLSEDTTVAEERAAAAVQEAMNEKRLDDEFVLSAIDNGDRRLVACALSALARTPKPIVDRILLSQSGKAITAFVWRAGLSMRVAVKIQTSLAHLSSAKVVLAREGVHFPLSTEEMAWHLNYFGVKD
jgi:uncharacterized protein (DUF2336 family)